MFHSDNGKIAQLPDESAIEKHSTKYVERESMKRIQENYIQKSIEHGT